MQGNKDNDNSIFNQIKAGNKLAFNSIFEDYYHELCEFSFRIIGRKDLAEEIVADVLANIWIKRKTITINSNLKAFLYISTKNMTISYMRKKNNKLLPLDDILAFQQHPNADTDGELIHKESSNSIDRMLASIPNKSRIVFKMHRLDNLKYREIAEILDISQKTVEKHMGKALKIIRSYNIETVTGLLLFALSFLNW